MKCALVMESSGPALPDEEIDKLVKKGTYVEQIYEMEQSEQMKYIPEERLRDDADRRRLRGE